MPRHLQQICSKISPMGCSALRPVAAATAPKLPKAADDLPPWPGLPRPPTSSAASTTAVAKTWMPGSSPGKGHLGSSQTPPFASTREARAGAVHAGCSVRVVRAVGLDQLQTPLEVAALDRPHK